MRTDTSRCQLSVDKRSLSAKDDLGKNATVEIVVAEPCSSVGYETGRRAPVKEAGVALPLNSIANASCMFRKLAAAQLNMTCWFIPCYVLTHRNRTFTSARPQSQDTACGT